MLTDAETFAEMVAELLQRFARQNALAAPSRAELVALGRRLRALLDERGWPRPLAAGEMGAPGEMSATEVEPLVARLWAGLGIESSPDWAVPLKQLIKACFHPWFLTCRESYREAGSDGTCRRQELDRARKRLSGAHCVDCPYWTTLTPGQHGDLLRRHWQPGHKSEFAAHREVFLPEDFRRLRLCLRAKNAQD